MSQLFLSHSSKDNFAALALADWLRAEGWDDLFLDLDPERGIVAGERWERALHQAAHRCDAVLFLVSSHWLSSEWCLREFELANRLNKRIFGLLIEDLDIKNLPSRLTETWQLVNLAGGRNHQPFTVTHPHTGDEGYIYFSKVGLKSLRTGLTRAGLDPRFFQWPPAHDPERPPYRGLRPLEADDAGIFFGREAPTIELIARLRGLRERSAPRLLAILGASGAGKSSFVRAGLLPRLAREDRHFLPLRILRPGSAVMSGEHGLIEVLVEALKPLKLARVQIAEALADPDCVVDWLMQRVRHAVADPEASFASLPTLVLCIDQAEELFFGESRKESDEFLALIRNLAARDDLPLIVLFTIRSDSYEALQHAKALQGMPQETFSLVPMPKGAYAEVIDGPAHRLNDTDRKLEIEPALRDTLLDDLDKGGSSDALPLLAFTLERLYRDFGDTGKLTKKQYLGKLEGISGSIKAATEEVFSRAQTNPKLPNDRNALEALAKRALIPWLVGIDLETRSPRRRVARMRDMPEETLPLVEEMVEQRLLTTDRISRKNGNQRSEITVEPAHEALLRQWGLLQGWLKEDLGVLATLEAIQRATRDWLARQKDDEWLNHSAGRLEEAEAVASRKDLDKYLGEDDHEYLRRCRKAYDARTQKELQDAKALAAAQQKAAEEQKNAAEEQKRAAEHAILLAKRTRVGLVVTITLLVGLAYFWGDSNTRKNEALIAQSEYLTDIANQKIQEGDPETAALIALEALPNPRTGNSRPLVHRAAEALYRATRAQRLRRVISGFNATVTSIDISDDGRFAVAASIDGTIREWALLEPASEWVYTGHRSAIHHVEYAPDGEHFITASKDRTVRIWRHGNPEPIVLEGHTDEVLHATVSPDGLQLVTSSKDGTARLWLLATGTHVDTLEFGESSIQYSLFSKDGTTVFSMPKYGDVQVWNPQRIGLAEETQYATPEVEMRRYIGIIHETETSPNKDSAPGVLILDVLPMGAAAAAGLRQGDVLRQIDGSSVEPDNIGTLLDRYEIGDSLQLLIARDSDQLTLDLVMGWKRSDLGQPLENDAGQVQAIVLSADGQMLATSHEGKHIVLWDADSLDAVTMIDGFNAGVSAMAFDKPARKLFSAHSDGAINIWDAHSGFQVRALEGHSAAIKNIGFIEPANMIVSASQNGQIMLHDINKVQPIQRIIAHEDGVASLTVNGNGNTFVSGGRDFTAKQWSLEQGVIGQIQHSGFPLVNYAVHEQEGFIATAFADGTIKISSIATGEQLQLLHVESPLIVDIGFIDPGLLVVCSVEGDVQLWSWREREEKDSYRIDNTSIENCIVTPEQRSLLVSLWGGQIASIDLTALREQYRIDREFSSLDQLEHSMMLPEFAVAGQGASLSIHQTTDGRQIAEFPEDVETIGSVAFHPTLPVLAVADWKAGLWLWRYKEQGHPIKLDTDDAVISKLAFGSDGFRLFAGAWDGQIMIWNAQNGKRETRFPAHDAQITGLVVDTPSARLYTGGRNGEVAIWSIEDRTLLSELFGEAYSIQTLSLAGKATRLIGTANNRKLVLWSEFSELGALMQHTRESSPRPPLSALERKTYHLRMQE